MQHYSLIYFYIYIYIIYILLFNRIKALFKPSQKSDHVYYRTLFPKIVQDIEVYILFLYYLLKNKKVM